MDHSAIEGTTLDHIDQATRGDDPYLVGLQHRAAAGARQVLRAAAARSAAVALAVELADAVVVLDGLAERLRRHLALDAGQPGWEPERERIEVSLRSAEDDRRAAAQRYVDAKRAYGA